MGNHLDEKIGQAISRIAVPVVAACPRCACSLAVVHRKAGFLWKHGEPEARADMLRAECDAKPDRPRPIGFQP